MARILAVDDSMAMRNLVKGILTGEGYEVLTAVDGADAMKVARKERVDLVLSDVNMPNMSGISLVTRLRSLDNYKFTPIIMVTTEGSDFKKDKARSFGATGWLQKPFTPERLLGAVKKVLG